MGLFWDYFKKELRFPPIFSPGPLAMLADGGAAILDNARDMVLQLRDQFLPFRCEDANLAHFARSRGLTRNPLEPDEHWQARVRFAYNWWIRGGRASAMAESLCKGFGFTWVDVHGLGDSDPLYDETTGALLYDETTAAPLEILDTTRWAEFMVIIFLQYDAQPYIQEQVIWAINEVKPARSKLAEVIYIAPLWDETTGAPLYDETTGALLTN